MLIRALLSWFPNGEGTKIGKIVYQLTEPIILPIRGLVSKSEIANRSMIDISFLVTLLILEMVKTFVGHLIGSNLIW